MNNELQVIPPNVSIAKTQSLREMFELSLRVGGPFSPATLYAKRRRFAFFERATKGKPLNKSTLIEYSIALQNNLDGSKRTAISHNCHAFTIKGFLKWLNGVGYLDQDITGVIKLQRRPVPPPAKVWTHGEYLRMVEFTRTRTHSQAHRWLFILGYRTGMSLVDCCHLRWHQVSLNENGPSWIEIYRTKVSRFGRKSFCQIPVVAGSDLHEELLKRKAVAHLNYKRFDGIQDYVHEDCPGLYITNMSMISQDFKKIWTYAGIDRRGRSFKTFRSTFISNLVNAGVQEAMISKMTGHQDLKTLMLYLKVDKLALQDQLSKSYEYGSRNDNRPITIAPSPTATATPAEAIPHQAARGSGK